MNDQIRASRKERVIGECHFVVSQAQDGDGVRAVCRTFRNSFPCPPVDTWCWNSPTPARGFLNRNSPRSSTRSFRPSQRTRRQDLDWPRSMERLRHTVAGSPFTAAWDTERASSCTSPRALRSPAHCSRHTHGMSSACRRSADRVHQSGCCRLSLTRGPQRLRPSFLRRRNGSTQRSSITDLAPLTPPGTGNC